MCFYAIGFRLGDTVELRFGCCRYIGYGEFRINLLQHKPAIRDPDHTHLRDNQVNTVYRSVWKRALLQNFRAPFGGMLHGNDGLGSAPADKVHCTTHSRYDLPRIIQFERFPFFIHLQRAEHRAVNMPATDERKRQLKNQ